VYQQISEGSKLLSASKGTSQQTFALIIDGKSLVYALEDGIKNKFLELATHCASVICCRSSPKQKALVCLSHFFFVSPLYTDTFVTVHVSNDYGFGKLFKLMFIGTSHKGY
jgi:hypothetical protein